MSCGQEVHEAQAEGKKKVRVRRREGGREGRRARLTYLLLENCLGGSSGIDARRLD